MLLYFFLQSNLRWTPVSLGSVHQCPIVQYLEYVTLALRDQNGDHGTEGPAHITLHITDTDKGTVGGSNEASAQTTKCHIVKLMTTPTTDC